MRSRLRNGFLIGILAAASVTGQELKPEQIYLQIAPAVMTLQVENVVGERHAGTAFLAFKEGVAVTAWHLVADAHRVTARFSDNLFADVVGVIDKDERTDLALVSIRVSDRARVRFATAAPAVGSRAFVISGGGRLNDLSISDFLVSQNQAVAGVKGYQISCPLSESNSGSPILNERGEAIGVTTWTRAGANILSVAIPSASLLALKPTQACKPWAELSKATGVVRCVSTPNTPARMVKAASFDVGAPVGAINE